MKGRWWRSVVLTGASGGIGRALAVELASNGVTMLLLGRDEMRLEATAMLARQAGAEVRWARADVRDAHAMTELLGAADREAPVDLVIANAGRSDGTRPIAGGVEDGAGRSALEPPGTLASLAATNLVGAANTVEPLLEGMRSRRHGCIVLVGSLAGTRPLPDMPAYSATKAGLRAWGTALRGALRGTGLRVSIVTAGFVTSPMSARHLGPRPFEMSAEAAARRMRRGIERGAPLVTFPAPLAALAWCGARLPAALSDFAIRPFGARIAPEDR